MDNKKYIMSLGVVGILLLAGGYAWNLILPSWPMVAYWMNVLGAIGVAGAAVLGIFQLATGKDVTNR